MPHFRFPNLKFLTPTVVIVAIFAALLAPVLGTSEVFQVSEAREGFVVEEILQSGNWVLPLRNGMFVPSKPPLFHWIGAALNYPFGSYNEFWLRLPSLIAALFTLAVVARFTSKLHSPLAGALAAGLLSSMYGFVRLASDGRVDMLFCLFYTAATLTALEMLLSFKPYERRHLLQFSLFCALATLTKGPLGIVLPFAIFGAAHLCFRGRKSLKQLIRPEFFAAVLIPLPWYLAAYQRGEGSFFQRQIIFENLRRFFGGEGIAEKDSWFYLPHLLSEGAPWSIFFLLYLFFLARESFKKRSVTSNRFIPADTDSAHVIISGLIWFGVVLTFLTFAAGKRRAYLLLTLPSIAIILAVRFASTYLRMKGEGRLQVLEKRLHYETFTWGVLVWFVGIIPGLIPFFIGVKEAKTFDVIIPRSTQFFSALESALIRAEFVFPLMFLVLSVASLALWVYGHKKQEASKLGWAVLLFAQLGIVFYVQVWMTIKGHTHTYKRLGLRLATAVPRDIPITLVKTEQDESFDGLFFYYKRHMFLLDPDGSPKSHGLYLARRDWYKTPRGLFYEELFSGGRIVDKPEDELVLFDVK